MTRARSKPLVTVERRPIFGIRSSAAHLRARDEFERRERQRMGLPPLPAPAPSRPKGDCPPDYGPPTTIYNRPHRSADSDVRRLMDLGYSEATARAAVEQMPAPMWPSRFGGDGWIA